MAEFLLEIGLEEVPARMIAGAQAELQQRVVTMLERERLLVVGPGAEVEVQSFATPRRLAVLVGGVAERQQDATEDILGPSVKVAGPGGLRDGAPTAAALAFAKKSGVEVSSLTTIATPRGDYLQAKSIRAGRTAAEVLAAEMPKELAAIYWAKNMYWRPGKPERFVRPVRWILALLGHTVVPISFAGKASGNITFGHRVMHGEAPVVVEEPAAYVETLRKAYVIADVEERRHRIRKSLDRASRFVEGARWREDHQLVETVTQLTEWPSVIVGGFEVEFLSLPEEVLATVMRDHQKYFAVERAASAPQAKDDEENTSFERNVLAPHFLAVLNTEVDVEGESIIRHGNERVLRARFNDARFFWEFDQRTPLTDRVAMLANVTFQRDLGSYAAKSERVRRVASLLAERVLGHQVAVDLEALDLAARLAKTDLTTELVKEFTELQGVIGGLYAGAQGLGQKASVAIYDHYLPQGTEDALPRSTEGSLLSIADKADTIAGMFNLGIEPTGSKDPFALRRAANGIVKILAQGDLPLALRDVAEAGAERKSDLVGRIIAFFGERVEFYLRESEGQTYDVVKAVMATGFDDIRDLVARARAITSVRAAGGKLSGEFGAVSAAFKRMGNILAQAREKGIAIPEHVEATLLLEPAERTLAERSAELAEQVEAKRISRDYAGALKAVATLRPQVDAFFDEVMVMVPEERLRANRLALLARIRENFSRIADFSEIVTAG